MSRIEQVIDEIEEYVASCKGPMFSSGTRVVIERERMEELLTELRQRTPDEIKKYQKIVSNKEAILAEARAQANQMIAEATAQTNELINEHEIMQRAYEQAEAIRLDAEKMAQEIVDRAVDEANAIREGAVGYTDEMLDSVLVVMKHAMEGADSKFAAYMQSMQSSYDIVESNLRELRGVSMQEQAAPAPAVAATPAQPVAAPVYEEEEEDEEEIPRMEAPARKVGFISEDDDEEDDEEPMYSRRRKSAEDDYDDEY